MTKKNIAIIGLGGVGGYFGFKINQFNEQSEEHHVTFVARNKTYQQVKENGLQLISSDLENNVTRPNKIIENISELKNPDLILICVKEYDLENICNQLTGVITKETILLPMMNGVDIYDRIRKIIPDNVILPSCVYVASHIKEKGIVEHKGKPGKLYFGNDPMHPDTDLEWITRLLDNSNINYTFRDDASIDIWTKFIFIASFGLVSAKYNSSIGAVCTEPQQKEEATEIMKEIKLIAHKKDIMLRDDIIENTFQKASTFPQTTPTSLQLDVNSGKQNNELELFAGAILKYGEELNVKCPATQKIYNEIKTKLANKINT
ncbi:2-dehydropantoate 2-reductase [Mangrovivirga sp. M17]|uniref:2-dehydropantoate 2-reductase n=1 Tax=Mangrovivirga halotolerans TaxID=2993936 RepID=A0ABT3RNH6_9BACT|nr:2-dehydropantoate 2-reductase [Mangrovivirga halotolerans]MCX2743329.1 2-dehydropantoate 2-reductase [Mangrovivirga halotolerans]